MKTTNYLDTFISVAADCPVTIAERPPQKGERKTVANLQFELIDGRPYQLTSDDVVFQVHAIRNVIPDEKLDDARSAFFSKGQPCLRSSPLAKRYGWGIHHDMDGKVALVAMESPEYQELASDPGIKQLSAMRSKRA